MSLEQYFNCLRTEKGSQDIVVLHDDTIKMRSPLSSSFHSKASSSSASSSASSSPRTVIHNKKPTKMRSSQEKFAGEACSGPLNCPRRKTSLEDLKGIEEDHKCSLCTPSSNNDNEKKSKKTTSSSSSSSIITATSKATNGRPLTKKLLQDLYSDIAVSSTAAA